MTTNPCPAIIYVDGEEFIRLSEADDYDAVLVETSNRLGGEVALMVYMPRYDAYLRRRVIFTESRSEI